MRPMVHARKQNPCTTKYSIPEHAWKICVDVHTRDLSSPRKMLGPSFPTVPLYSCVLQCALYLLTSLTAQSTAALP